MNLVGFWTDAHRRRDPRWLALSEPHGVIARLGVDLSDVDSILEIGPGVGLVADHLTNLGKRVIIHDIVDLDDDRYVATLPLESPVDAALAHLVFQHVPQSEQRGLIQGVLSSLKPGRNFYFDVCTEDTSENAVLAEEYADGLSFPFAAWDLVSMSRRVAPGYFFCVATA